MKEIAKKGKQYVKDENTKDIENTPYIISKDNDMNLHQSKINKNDSDEKITQNDKSISLTLTTESKQKNRGTGAGGKNTNKTGKSFEEKTSMEEYLEKNGYNKTIFDKKTKSCYNYEKKINGIRIIHLKQTGLKKYLNINYNIKDLYKQPDEAYIIENGTNKILKILEKKNQNVAGSVEEKLKSAVYVRDIEYGKNTNGVFSKIEYGYCVSQYLYNTIIQNKKKYLDMQEYFNKNNIQVFNGDDENYHETLYNNFVIKI